MNLLDRIRWEFLRFAGYIVPLGQLLPPLGLWTVLMTLPFARYLTIVLVNLPVNLLRALSDLFVPFLVPFLKANRRGLDVLVSISIPAVFLLQISIQIGV